MVDFDIVKVLDKLRKERKVFSSEADFKFSLAWAIKEYYRGATVICEYSPDYLSKVEEKESRIHIDILVKYASMAIPIELKYKTKAAIIEDIRENETKRFVLANQGARDSGVYGFARDVCRLKEFLNECKVDKGYALFLTNDPNYSMERKGTRANEDYTIDKIFEYAGEKRVFKVDGGNRVLNIPQKEAVIHSGWEDYSKCGEAGKDNFVYWLSTVKQFQK